MFKTSTKRTQEDDLPDVARFMPRVYEDDDIDVDGGGNDLHDDLDASNEEEVNVKEEEETEEKEEKVVEAAAVTVKKSKSKRIEEEELRPEEQGCSEYQSV